MRREQSIHLDVFAAEVRLLDGERALEQFSLLLRLA
jgi:hypothetical protein